MCHFLFVVIQELSYRKQMASQLCTQTLRASIGLNMTL